MNRLLLLEDTGTDAHRVMLMPWEVSWNCWSNRQWAPFTVTRDDLNHGSVSGEGMVQASALEASAADEATNEYEVYNAEAIASECYDRMGSIFRVDDNANGWMSRSEYGGCSGKNEPVDENSSTIPVKTTITGQAERRLTGGRLSRG